MPRAESPLTVVRAGRVRPGALLMELEAWVRAGCPEGREPSPGLVRLADRQAQGGAASPATGKGAGRGGTHGPRRRQRINDK